MTLPPRFRKDSETAIATYNFVDIASGTGFVKFYLAESWTGSAVSKLLTTNTPYSNTISQTGISNVNYDTSPFNLPQTLRGTALCQLGAGTSSSANLVITAQVQKWDGTTETNLSSVVSQTFTPDTAGKMFLFELPLTETNIKKGEQIRLNVTMDISAGQLGHDPQGREEGVLLTASQLTSASNIDMPFRIDL